MISLLCCSHGSKPLQSLPLIHRDLGAGDEVLRSYSPQVCPIKLEIGICCCMRVSFLASTPMHYAEAFDLLQVLQPRSGA